MDGPDSDIVSGQLRRCRWRSLPLVAYWRVAKRAGMEFFGDQAMSLAAAIAYYSALSFAPLLVIMIWIGSLLGDAAQQNIVGEITAVLGDQAGEAVQVVLQNSDRTPGLQSWAGVLGFGALLFSATGIFAQLQLALNRIFGVEATPGSGVLYWLQKRLLSLGMIVVIAFLLLVSLFVSATLGFVLPEKNNLLWELVHSLALTCLATCLFTLVYRILPDLHLPWHLLWPVSAVTAVLFVTFKFGVSVYLAHSNVGGSYGAAGSLVVLLVWMFFSSMTVLFGAELARSVACEMQLPVQAEKHGTLLPRKWGEQAEAHSANKAVADPHRAPEKIA